MMCFFFFKQKTAYEMRISDWSSDVCSSDLFEAHAAQILFLEVIVADAGDSHELLDRMRLPDRHHQSSADGELASQLLRDVRPAGGGDDRVEGRGGGQAFGSEIGRAHVCTPVTNAQLVCRLLLVQK